MSTEQSDLQSFGELERYLYGGNDSYSYFNTEIQKCMPFTQTPYEINKCNGTPNFGYSWTLVVNNNYGDYLTNMWICVDLPEITLKPENIYKENGTLRWTKNLLHNLIEECSLTFNGSVISKIDNFSLDFISEFTLKEGKYNSYMENIGNISKLTEPSTFLEGKKLLLPLPLFFCKDTGNAIPLVALPHTEIRLNFKFKNWENLLIHENSTYVDANTSIPLVGRDIEDIPKLSDAKLFGTFITVSEEERMKIKRKVTTMIIEQIQTSPRQMISEKTAKIDLLFKQSVKTLYFAVRNTTFKNVWSNYNYNHDKFVGKIFTRNSGNNIIKSVSIKYNDNERGLEMPFEYFQYMNPYYHADRVTSKTGIAMYSYALNISSIDPIGGVSLSRIDNPSLNVKLTEESQKSGDSFELIVVAVSNNIIKFKDGIFTFPVINNS